MTFGSHIRMWREERGLGLRRFAKAVAVSPTFISKMERGLGPLPKVATDVLAVIIQQPAYARFLRNNQHPTQDQWETLTRSLKACLAKESAS